MQSHTSREVGEALGVVAFLPNSVYRVESLIRLKGDAIDPTIKEPRAADCHLPADVRQYKDTLEQAPRLPPLEFLFMVPRGHPTVQGAPGHVLQSR